MFLVPVEVRKLDAGGQASKPDVGAETNILGVTYCDCSITGPKFPY